MILNDGYVCRCDFCGATLVHPGNKTPRMSHYKAKHGWGTTLKGSDVCNACMGHATVMEQGSEKCVTANQK